MFVSNKISEILLTLQHCVNAKPNSCLIHAARTCLAIVMTSNMTNNTILTSDYKIAFLKKYKNGCQAHRYLNVYQGSSMTLLF